MKRMMALVCLAALGLPILPESSLHAGGPPPNHMGSKVKKPEPPPPPPQEPPPPPSPPPPPPPEPDDFLPFFQFIVVSVAPMEPCCRRPEPDMVTVRGTGEMNWGPWDYQLLPCDYGEKMVDPADKSCRTVNDCMMLPVSWDCCGSLLLAGISKQRARRYLLLNHKCRPVLNWCDCPPGAYHAEDFKTSDDPADIRLECRRGQCRTFLKRD